MTAAIASRSGPPSAVFGAMYAKMYVRMRVRSITVLTSEIHCSARAGVGREDVWGRVAAIEIRGDRLRFEEFEIAVAKDRHFAEGIDGEDLRRVQRPLRYHVLYSFLLADHAHGAR